MATEADVLQQDLEDFGFEEFVGMYNVEDMPTKELKEYFAKAEESFLLFREELATEARL